MSTALLIDGNNILRSAMAVNMDSDLSANGVSTGPLTIFINRIARHIREEVPERVLVAWDSAGRNRRTALLATYKANRRPAPTEELERRESHFVLAKQFCAAAGVGQLALPGYEADDVIAGAWRTLGPRDVDKIVILSNDTDFFQLLGQNPQGVETEQIRLSSSRGKTDRLTATRICAEMEVGHPSDLGRIKVLTGDVSDNVPGLKGIGPKRAHKMLAANLWDLNEIARVHPEHRDLIALNEALINLRHSSLTVRVPLWNPTQHTSIGFSEFRGFLHRYELRGATDRLMAGTLWAEPDPAIPLIGKRLKLGGPRE